MFREQSALKNICISEDHQMKSGEDLQPFFRKFNSDTRVKVIVLFTGLEDTKHILSEAEKYMDRNVVWVGPDAWGKQQSAMSPKAVGAITITLKADESLGFTNYLKQRRPEANDPNPWMLDFWNQRFKCNPPFDPQEREGHSNCTGNERLVDAHFVQDDKVPFVISAVQAVFTALKKTLVSSCESSDLVCERFTDAIEDGRFHSNLLNVSFYAFDG